MKMSDIMAIISLVVSAGVAVYQYCMNKRINDNNLKSYYFNEIYREHLIKEIPKARNHISIDCSGKVVGHKVMIEEMKKIQQDSLFYKYNDEKYFKKLREVAQALEEYLIDADKKTYIGEDQTDFLNELTSKLSDLYKVLNDQYLK